MGKRSNFKRFKQDAYDTPLEAVEPLFPFLLDGTFFCEPCAGNGMLTGFLRRQGHYCVQQTDIRDGVAGIYHKDVEQYNNLPKPADCFITNPPWERRLLHNIIYRLSKLGPTWLLIDADWMHTKQAVPYLARCRKIVSIGRVKWIPDSKYTGKDNCCWYLFGKHKCEPTFYGRTP